MTYKPRLLVEGLCRLPLCILLVQTPHPDLVTKAGHPPLKAQLLPPHSRLSSFSVPFLIKPMQLQFKTHRLSPCMALCPQPQTPAHLSVLPGPACTESLTSKFPQPLGFCGHCATTISHVPPHGVWAPYCSGGVPLWYQLWRTLDNLELGVGGKLQS